MALQLVEGLLNKLEEKDSVIKATRIKIENKTEIKMQRISCEEDWEMANKLCSNAFGTMIDPIYFQYPFVLARRYFNEAFIAIYRGVMVGVIMCIHWGSIRCIGPLAVSTKYQRNGIAAIMMNYILKESPQIINNNKIKRDVLDTYCASFHVALYMRFGFQPRFISYGTSMEIKNDLFPQKYLNNIVTRIDKYKFIHYKDENENKEFVSQTRVLCNTIYKGYDLSVIIKGHWKCKEIGGCYALYDKNDKLNGFTVLKYGANANVISPNHLKIDCLVAINEETFGVLLFNVINAAKQMDKIKVFAKMNTARTKAFAILTKTFDFVYDPTKPLMTMGQCRGDDTEYDDHNLQNSFVIDTK